MEDDEKEETGEVRSMRPEERQGVIWSLGKWNDKDDGSFGKELCRCPK